MPCVAHRLDPSIYEALQKEGVAVGDVVYVEANSGAVKRVGRSDAYATVNWLGWIFHVCTRCCATKAVFFWPRVSPVPA